LQVHVIQVLRMTSCSGGPSTYYQSVVRNFANEGQTITIHDPNSGQNATVPTFARGTRRYLQRSKEVELPVFAIRYLIPHQGDRVYPLRRSATNRLPSVSPLSVPSFTLSIPDLRLVTVYHYDLFPNPLIVSPSFFENQDSPLAIFAKKKYKPVAQKVRPSQLTLPERFRILREIRGDPLASMPNLSPISPLFTPTGRYTLGPPGLYRQSSRTRPSSWPEERALMHQFMCLPERRLLAWDDSERGTFPRRLFFSACP